MDLSKVMSQEQAQVFNKAFSAFFLSDQYAISLAQAYLFVSHIWDDLIDGDEVSQENIDLAFRALLIEIPTNPLFQKYSFKLLPVLTSVYTQWVTANQFEASKVQLEKAYMLRASIYQLFVTLAEITGGLDWAVKISPDVYSLYGESVEELKQELQ